MQSEKGPEAGVWVIAETKDFQTPMVKIVVTNDDGKFALPELPVANYKVWVRGFGLADSNPHRDETLHYRSDAQGSIRQPAQEAAKVYPGDYWLSMMAPPAKDLFPGTGSSGNGLGLGMTESGPLGQFAEIGLQLLPSARQCADSRCKPCLRRQARAQDSHGKPGSGAWEWEFAGLTCIRCWARWEKSPR